MGVVSGRRLAVERQIFLGGCANSAINIHTIQECGREVFSIWICSNTCIPLRLAVERGLGRHVAGWERREASGILKVIFTFLSMKRKWLQLQHSPSLLSPKHFSGPFFWEFLSTFKMNHRSEGILFFFSSRAHRTQGLPVAASLLSRLQPAMGRRMAAKSAAPRRNR